MCSWWNAKEIPKPREFIVKLHLVNGDQYVWLPDSPMSQLAAHRSHQQFGVSQTLCVNQSGLCSCRFVFLQERPWQSIMIFRAIWQEAGSGYSCPWNDSPFCDRGCAVEHFSFDWSHPVVLSMSTKRLLNSFRTQQTLYYQSINLATCFGSLSHHQANWRYIEWCAYCGITDVYSRMTIRRISDW
jgi:hypothetical protein